MTPETARVLRFHDEPCQWFHDTDVHAALMADPGGWLDHMDRSLVAIARGDRQLELPPKQVFVDPDDHSDFRVMPCVVRGDGEARKTVKIVGTNGPRRVVPDQLTVGRALALHPQENFVTAVFDACALSSARTGAVAALAGRHLARRRGHLAIHGCGRVGYYTARLFVADGGIERISLHDPDSARVEAMQAALSEVSGMPETAASPAAQDADITVLATDSEIPLELMPGEDGVIISMGADTVWQRELPPALARSGTICVDSRDSLHTGDLAAWVSSGLVARGDIVDFLDIVRAKPSAPRPQLFVSTGSALFDNLTIDWLLRDTRDR